MSTLRKIQAGIPQGSVLMDFIAEMILGYADKELSKKIEDNQISNYQILRYRDDYRIFEVKILGDLNKDDYVKTFNWLN